MNESDLYPVLKTYLEAQGYVVKAEIGACDLMARRGDEPPLIVEMKLTFSLGLVMQGVARQGMFDTVYLAVPVSGARGWKLRYKDILGLCRRLGLGLIAVRLGAAASVEVHLDPAPYAPRKNVVKSAQLLREFDRRAGDPNLGGTRGVKQMTAYRQDALRCALYLASNGASKAAIVASATGVTRAATLMRSDHYGWFARAAPGIYLLTANGMAGLAHFGADAGVISVVLAGNAKSAGKTSP